MAKKYIDAEKLRAEIEKRMEKHWGNLPDADSPEDDWTHNELCELGAYKELEHIEDLLNSLQQEQPEKINVTGDDFSWIDELKHDLEHPEELDERVAEAFKNRGNFPKMPSNSQKNMAEAAEEVIRQAKAHNRKFCIPEPHFDDVQLMDIFKAGVYWMAEQEHNDKAVQPEGLDEAAEEYSNSIAFCGNDKEIKLAKEQSKCDFKAGAEWQKEQNDKDLSEKIAAAYQLGLANKEKQMMKEAVEVMVTTNLANRPIIYLDELKGFQYGDKVRIIIVKED